MSESREVSIQRKEVKIHENGDQTVITSNMQTSEQRFPGGFMFTFSADVQVVTHRPKPKKIKRQPIDKGLPPG